MTQGGNELVEVGIDARPADKFDPGLGLASVGYALIDLLLGLADEGVEEMVQRIFPHRLELVCLLVVARLGAMVVMALARGPAAWCPLRFALRYTAVIWDSLAVRRIGGRLRLSAVGCKGFDYGFLRHDGSIESSPGGGDDLGAQRAGRGRVDEAGVPRVLYAMHDGGIAVVGVGARGLALEGGQGAVRTGAVAANDEGRRLGARRFCSAGRGRQRPTACLAGWIAGSRRGVLYMVRHIPSRRSSLQEGKSSCSKTAWVSETRAQKKRDSRSQQALAHHRHRRAVDAACKHAGGVGMHVSR